MLSPQPPRAFKTLDEIARRPELAIEAQRLATGDLAARYPLALQCTRCQAYYLWLATALRLPVAPVPDRLNALAPDWQPLRWNFVATIAETAFCPGCRFSDEYALTEDPRPAFTACLERLETLGTPEARQLAARLDPIGARGPRPRNLVDAHLELAARLAGPRQDAISLTRVAQNALELRQSVRALAGARAALAVEPRALEPHLVMAEVARLQRVWSEALNFLRRAADLLAGGSAVRLIRSADRAAALVAEALAEVGDRAPDLWTPQDDSRLDATRALTGAPSWMS